MYYYYDISWEGGDWNSSQPSQQEKLRNRIGNIIGDLYLFTLEGDEVFTKNEMDNLCSILKIGTDRIDNNIIGYNNVMEHERNKTIDNIIDNE